MECLGGNGYVEEGGEGIMARIYREMPLNSIWEGAGNIMALDLLRALRKGDAVAALTHELAPARGAHAALDRLADALPARIEDDGRRDRGAPSGAGRGAGRAGCAARADRAGRGVRCLLRVTPGRRLGQCLRHAGRGAPISIRSSSARSPADCTLNEHTTTTHRKQPMADLILHHYTTSPFSEKVRLDPRREEAAVEVGVHSADHAQARRGGAHGRLPQDAVPADRRRHLLRHAR